MNVWACPKGIRIDAMVRFSENDSEYLCSMKDGELDDQVFSDLTPLRRQ
jgi:hypothetical protein